MVTIRAQVILHTADNFAANYITNSFAFTGTDPVPVLSGITTAIKDFYDDITPSMRSSELAQNGHEIKYYDLPGPTPNYPIDEDTFNFGAASTGTPLPQECAICLSFQGTRVPGFPQARRRGRLYLGTWGTSANSGGRPASALISTISTAAATFKSNILALGDDTVWSIWSVADQTGVPIDNGWIDNVWDTQRRRGVVETSRTTWS